MSAAGRLGLASPSGRGRAVNALLAARPSVVVSASARPAALAAAAPAKKNSYNITLLPGDGIGPEIIAVAVSLLKEVRPPGFSKIDHHGPPWWSLYSSPGTSGNGGSLRPSECNSGPAPPSLSHPQVSKKEGVTFNFTEAPMGGAAIDLTGEPLPASTLKTCLARGAGMWLLGGIVL